MITKADAIKTGKVITKMLPEINKEQNSTYCSMMRGTLLYALDNYYHDVLPDKVRLSFLNKSDFYDQCGWI